MLLFLPCQLLYISSFLNLSLPLVCIESYYRNSSSKYSILPSIKHSFSSQTNSSVRVFVSQLLEDTFALNYLLIPFTLRIFCAITLPFLALFSIIFILFFLFKFIAIRKFAQALSLPPTERLETGRWLSMSLLLFNLESTPIKKMHHSRKSNFQPTNRNSTSTGSGNICTVVLHEIWLMITNFRLLEF